MTDLILTAGVVITMDDKNPRAEAVAVSDGKIVAVGSLADCQAALPSAEVVDTKAGALMPGFIESHGHPVLSGVATQAPAHSIAPWDAPTWDDVLAIFKKAMDTQPEPLPLLFNGFDALLHERPIPDASVLDPIFGDRIALVADNSGHGVYFTTALIKANGWDTNPPADPVGGSLSRDADGKLTGQAWELPGLLMVTQPVMAQLGGNPLHSAMEFYRLMAENGITSTSEMTYNRALLPAYEAMASMPDNPMRISLYHISTEDGCELPVESKVSSDLLVKGGIKLWADGSPWVGNIGITFPYLETEATKRAGISNDRIGDKGLNYTRSDLDALMDKYAPTGNQFSVHANGDLAIDIVLDAMERALVKYDLLGTNHGWRIEHVGAGRRDHFDRAKSLGVQISMGPFQFYYWGDLLDGQMFESKYGSQWQAFKDAFDSGCNIAFHNDGAVSPPTPLLNIQAAVTRRTRGGHVRGENQQISLHEGLAAETINAAHMLKREAVVGSIEVGKFADFVELSADPYTVDVNKLATECTVSGTWLGGRRVDLDAFLNMGKAVPADEHKDLHKHAAHRC
ncbi:MAG: hypothetical protein RLZZ600_651 [Actinomycetota bacterium]|jgi:predicted amidohydrolase YtcJ